MENVKRGGGGRKGEIGFLRAVLEFVHTLLPGVRLKRVQAALTSLTLLPSAL